MNAKSLIEEIKEEYKRLRNFLVREAYHRKKESPDLVKLDNLFKGLKDFIRGSVRTPFVHPAKIFNYKASIRRTKITGQDKNTIAQAASDLNFHINEDAGSYYESEGQHSRIRFDIESFQQEGKYRLRAEVDDKDIIEIIERRQESQYTLEEQRRILGQYLTQVEKEYRYLDIKHLQILPLRRNSIKLDKVYIRLKAIKEVPQSEALYLTEGMKDLSGLTERFIKEKKISKYVLSPSVSMEHVLQDTIAKQNDSEKNLLILGLPGSGKSCFLRYLAWLAADLAAADRRQEWGLTGFIPFFIDLGKYVISGYKGLIDYCLSEAVENISSEAVKNTTKTVLGELIEKYGKISHDGLDRRIIFLLDAFDETRDKKEKVVREIEDMRSRYENALFIVTSRITGYYDVPLTAFTPYLIEDIQIDGVFEFVRNWFGILASERAREEPEDWNNWAKERTNDLIHKIGNNTRLKRIATTPLYLTFLVLLTSDPNTELPETRADLLKGYFDKLILNWEEKHKVPDSEDLVKGFSSEDLLKGFNEISWIIHRALFGDIRNDPSEEFIKKRIGKSLVWDPGRLINFWIKAGIFLRVQTKNPLKELILPRHLSFLEYGFACKLAELWDNEKARKALQRDLKINLHNEYLYEPLLIFIEKMKSPITFIEYVRNLKDDLFHSNLIFLCEAIREVSNKFELRGIVTKLLFHLHQILYSQSLFNESVQSDICKCIYLLGGNEALMALLKETSDLSIIIKALPDIAPLCDKSIIPLLKELLERVNEEYDRERVIECIAIVEREAALPFLLKLYEKEEAMREGIVDAIMTLMEENAIAILKELHEKYETAVHLDQDILVTIGKLGEVEYAIRELQKRLDVETEFWHRIIIARGIADLRAEIGINILQQLYKETNDERSRNQVLLLVRSLESRIAIPILKELINIEQNKSLRRVIAIEMARCGEKDIIPYLKELYDQTHDSKTSIILAFAEVLDRSDIPYLKKIYDEANSFQKVIIAYTIGKVGGVESAIEFYEDLFKQMGPSEQLTMSETLIEFGKEKMAIVQLNEIFKKRISRSSKREVIMAVSLATNRANLLIFSDKKGGWKLMEISERYSFSSLSTCNCHNNNQD